MTIEKMIGEFLPARNSSLLLIIIIIIQEISIALNPVLKAGAQCAHRKTQNEITYIKTKAKKDKQSTP